MTEVNQVAEWLTKPAEIDINLPAWLIAYRAKHRDAFASNGLPTSKNERWKYADATFLSKQDYVSATRVNYDELTAIVNQHRLQDTILVTMVNGYFMPQLSELHVFPDNVVICDVVQAWQEYADLSKIAAFETKDYPFASLNIANAVSGIFLYLPKDTQLEKPVHLLSIMTGQENIIAHSQHFFMLGEASKLTIVEEFCSTGDQSYLLNTLSTISLDKKAEFHQVKLQHESLNAVHIANKFVQQQQDSNAYFTHFATGARFAREDITLALQESGANCKTAGFYHLTKDNQLIDNHVDVLHQAPRSDSEMLYKGILDKKSRAIFNGRLCVKKDAQKILAYQANHNLLLSNLAEVYSKPELEIYADDVKCKHGASTGQLDQEALFYLRSRGIPYKEAMDILLQGFAEEVLQRVTHAATKQRVQEILR